MDNLLDEIYQYLEGAQRYDRYIASLCPFHDDSRPSFFVYADGYSCKSCGKRGYTKNLLTDLQIKQGVFMPKKERLFLSPWTNWERQYGDLEHVIQLAHKNLINHNKTTYLRKRKINMDTILSLEIGWLDDWITLPVHNCTGKLIGGIARAGETNKSQAKYCTYPGMTSNMIYVPDWKMIQYSNQIYLTFGILDAVSLYQLDYASASTITGKNVDPVAFDTIRKRIAIIPDDGEEIEAIQLVSKLGWRGSVMKIAWLEDCKDINDLMMKDEEYLKRILEDQEKLYASKIN